MNNNTKQKRTKKQQSVVAPTESNVSHCSFKLPKNMFKRVWINSTQALKHLIEMSHWGIQHQTS